MSVTPLSSRSAINSLQRSHYLSSTSYASIFLYSLSLLLSYFSYRSFLQHPLFYFFLILHPSIHLSYPILSSPTLPSPYHTLPYPHPNLFCPIHQPLPTDIEDNTAKAQEAVSLRMLPLSSLLSYSQDDSNERIFEASIAAEMLRSLIR